MPDDFRKDDSGAEADDAGLDELVEPSVDLRTAQERERAEPANDAGGEATWSRGGELESDVRDGVDELVDPSTELRTVQEQEQEVDEDAGGGGDE
ncbi:hypothetical protein [Halobacterium salinarum]|uniref:hypothetical protein n=1 Tax=Halobacterium salinarum TaxID=2242 RepID=UPI002555AB26|nr:hypothetical protein [Halobacterium salinarum]MDL0134455.1 hypothetical protein [Halobacterium salinarum]